MYDFQQRTTEITHDSIKKRFRKAMTPWKVISEYVWNGLDEQATHVEVIIRNSHMGGVESIEIHDNGNGIDFNNPQENFGKFDDSSKNDFTKKGSQGRGRYSFQKLAATATWFTRCNNEDAIFEIHSTKLKNYNFTVLKPEQQKERIKNNGKGTSVYLTGLPKEKAREIPSAESIAKSLSREIGWKLILNENLKVTVNSIQVIPSEHELLEETITIHNRDFLVSFIRWIESPLGENSYCYFLDSSQKEKTKQTSGFNYKNDFYLSNFVRSEWFDNFQKANENNTDLFIDDSKSNTSSEFKKLSGQIRKISKEIYQNFLRERAISLVDEFKSKGYFPEYKNESIEDREFRTEHTRKLIVNVCIADPTTFNNLKPKQTKIIIALLDKLTVSSENDSLFDVLEGILELNQTQLDEFSSQIKKSKLDHIISAISLIQKRDEVVHKMKRLFKDHTEHVLETPDLQGIIEANTWLFGAQYETIGAEEPDFYENAKTLWSKDKEIEGLSKLEQEDLIDGATIKDAKGEVDLFLAKKLLTVDHSTGEEFIKCTIIEIKRPSLSLNNKCVRQVERYREVLDRHPAFNDEKMRFDVILVGTKFSQYASNIKTRLKDNAGKAGQGLLLGAEDRIKVYVRTWATIFNDFDITHKHLLKKLRINRAALQPQTKDNLVNELQEPTD